MIVDRYCYGRLPANEQAVYREIYQGCMEHKSIIPLSASESEISKSYARIMSAVTDDNPLLYFVNQSVSDFAVDGNGNVAVIPQYFFKQENVAKYNQKIQDAANKLIYDLKLTKGSELDKVRKVHDYMCAQVKYDHDGSDTKNLKSFIFSHNIMGVFANKKAQCEGIAKAAKVLLNAVDVKCIYITGHLRNEHGGADAHGWNIVSIDGVPYHLDITMDIGATVNGNIGYDYFNLTDAQIRKNHVFSTGYPKCIAEDANYFVENDLVFSSKKQLKEYIHRSLQAGEQMLYFKLIGKLKTSNIIDYVSEILCDLSKDSVTLGYVVNSEMNTCRIRF